MQDTLLHFYFARKLYIIYSKESTFVPFFSLFAREQYTVKKRGFTLAPLFFRHIFPKKT